MTDTPYLTATAAKERDSRLVTLGLADEAIERQVRSFEEAAEEYRGVAYTPRTEVQTFHLVCADRVLLARTRVRSVTSITLDGTSVAASRYKLDAAAGVLRFTGPVSGVLVVTYPHGHDEPSSVLLDACTEYVVSALTSRASGASRNTLSQGGAETGTTRYSTPNMAAGRPTGWLEVDRLLNTLADERVGLA